MLTDVWAELKQVFGLQIADLYPGIQVQGLNYESQKTVLDHVFENVSEVDAMLEDVVTGIEILPPTPDKLIQYMLSEDVDGMVWVSIKRDGLTLPPLGLFTPNYSNLSIHFIPGMWSPVELIGLLEFLRWINDIGDHLKIRMEQETAPKILCEQFDETWQTYIEDNGSLA